MTAFRPVCSHLALGRPRGSNLFSSRRDMPVGFKPNEGNQKSKVLFRGPNKRVSFFSWNIRVISIFFPSWMKPPPSFVRVLGFLWMWCRLSSTLVLYSFPLFASSAIPLRFACNSCRHHNFRPLVCRKTKTDIRRTSLPTEVNSNRRPLQPESNRQPARSSPRIIFKGGLVASQNWNVQDQVESSRVGCRSRDRWLANSLADCCFH